VHTTYQQAYSKTISTISSRVLELQATLLIHQETNQAPHSLWERCYLGKSGKMAGKPQRDTRYLEAQLKLNYLINLILFIERDQLKAMPEELDAFYVKRDLYWWKSALSLVGDPAYLEKEIIATDYYELAQRQQSTVRPAISQS